MRSRSRNLFANLVALHVGCAPFVFLATATSGTACVASEQKPSAGKKPSKPPTGKDGVRVELNTWAAVKKDVARHTGKVVVVDLWASWCEPCVKELPHLAALQRKHKKDVVAVSFNLDHDGDPKDEKALAEVQRNVLKRLRKLKFAPVRNVVSRESGEKVYQELKIDSVPTILVFDKAGKMSIVDVNSAGGDPSYEKHVAPLVEKFVKAE